MRVSSLSTVFTAVAALTALTLLPGAYTAAYAQIAVPKLDATIADSPADLTSPTAFTSYFVLDFHSGSIPQSFAFAYKWSGSKTGGDLVDALSGAGIGFSDTFQTFPPFGRFFDSFTYGGHSVATPGDFSSFWSYWNSTDGLNWTEAVNGSDLTPLVDGSWDGWSFTPSGSFLAPRTPLAGTAAPEPGTFGLLLMVGGTSGVAALAGRRRSSRKG